MEPSVTTIIRQQIVLWVRTGQRLETPIGYEESNEGGEHPASKSTSRKTGVLRPAFSTKPTEPTAPINNTVTAIVCKRLRVRFFFMLLIFCCQS